MPAVRALTTQNPDIVVFVGNNIYVNETPRTWGVIGTDIDGVLQLFVLVYVHLHMLCVCTQRTRSSGIG